MGKESRRRFFKTAVKLLGAFFLGQSCSKRCPEESLGMDYLCSSCQKLGFPMAVGTCSACGRMTSSIGLKLCNSCGCKLDQCQSCLKSL